MAKGDEKNDYRAMFDKAKAEYESLGGVIERADIRRTQLQQLMTALAPLIDKDPPEVQTGLTDAMRQVLRAAPPMGLRPVDILSHLKALGVELPDNPLVAIHVTLKRLIKNDEVIPTRDPNGVKLYRRGPNLMITQSTGVVTTFGDWISPVLAAQDRKKKNEK